MRESTAVASRVVDEIRFPMVRLNTAIQSFTKMDKIRITATTILNSVGVGLSILSSDEYGTVVEIRIPYMEQERG